ncbi:MAG: phospho-N-acetylmuramoyl-pentapeptide-transferase [Verrucomicrobia bacterium]|nr:phospho-N-acetylmuramoyl-pentapeptide-transferase [Verrucomicrobiota bacterium]
MLYYLFTWLQQYMSPLRVFQYLSVRATLAAITAMALSIMLGPWLIRKLYALKIGQPIRKDECPPLHALHRSKEGTPTMGGVLIVAAMVLPTLLWADMLSVFVLLVVGATLWLGVLGGIDDYLKIKQRNSKGLRARTKLAWQVLLGALVGCVLVAMPEPGRLLSTTQPNLLKSLSGESAEEAVNGTVNGTHPAPDVRNVIRDYGIRGYPKTLFLPFYRYPLVWLGAFYALLAVFVIAGSSNAVNLTDGLDGLAIGCSTTVAFVYVVISYLTGNFLLADYLNIEFINGSGELVIFLASMIGAGLGFLWFNAHPAQIFMGDTGSLALGGALGTVALIVKKEFLLLIAGGIFVIEALSVILQVAFFKWKRRRIFRMSPLHHHFEMCGWSETKVTVRFWIIAITFALLSLASLKLQ